MAMVIRTFARTVTTAGTAVPLSTTQIFTTAFMVRANASNTGEIYVGDANVAASNAPPLYASETNEKEGQPTNRGVIKTFDLSKIYINSSVSAEGVKCEYVAEE